MKITDIQLTQDSDFAIASARVSFEQSDHPDKHVYVKTPKAYARGFGANPDAFLVGCLLPALHLGEKRIFVEEAVCPFLKEGVHVAMHILSHWTQGRYVPIPVESGVRKHQDMPAPRAGMVMSGGMDSLAALPKPAALS